MAVAINKKGVFFTFAAIVLAIIILLSFHTYNEYRLKDSMESTEIRIDTMNNFVKDLENNIGDATFIAAFRALLSLEDYMMEYERFMGEEDSPDLATGFKDLFLYGSITTGVNTEGMGLMHNNTFLNWTDRMKVQSNKTDIVLKFTVNDVTISQSEPWKVDVSMDINVEAKDKKGAASWTINKAITKKINITGFVDPLYLVNNIHTVGNSKSTVNNTIRITPVDPAEDNFKLDTHLINSYYIENSNAPSYLMRFENDLGSSAHGIESLVNLRKLEDAGLPTSSRSAVDYIYFGTQTAANCRVKKSNYEWFRLDKLPYPQNHLDFYHAQCKEGGGDDD